MKFAAVALLLGCSALACKYAVQSNLLQFETPQATEQPALRSALERLRFAFPHHEAAPVAASASRDAASGPDLRHSEIPLLPKAETLGLIAAAAAKHNVPAAFVQSIVAAESNFNCGAISPRGAIGLMQLMPETASQYGADPKIPEQNIDAGTRYLRWLM